MQRKMESEIKTLHLISLSNVNAFWNAFYSRLNVRFFTARVTSSGVCSRFVAHDLSWCRMPRSYTLAVVLLRRIFSSQNERKKENGKKRKRHFVAGFAYRVKICSVRSDSFSRVWKGSDGVVDVDGERCTRNANNIAFLLLFTLPNILRWWSNVSTKNLYRRCSRITNLEMWLPSHTICFLGLVCILGFPLSVFCVRRKTKKRQKKYGEKF